MWLHALAECPNNAEVFYHCCKFLMAQVSLLSSLFAFFSFSNDKKVLLLLSQVLEEAP